nr:aspartic proteinase [Colletotrichum truncatum]KAF6783153.1 aspartic proteinase [Colletotrichum truncatum]
MLSRLAPFVWLAMAHALPVDQDPSSIPAPGSPFTIPVRVNPHYVPDGPADLVAAYRKWNMPVPEALEKHLLTRRAGTNGDSYWLSEIFVGTPEAQAIPVLIDSGSSDFWLMSTDTQFGNAAKNGKPKLYDPSKSEASQEVAGASWNLQYHDGSSSSGKVYLDMLRIGLMTDYNWFNISNATIQSAVSVTNRLAVDPNLSGVLGLAKQRPSNIQPRMPSIMDRLKQELHFEFIGADLRANSSLGSWNFGSSQGGGKNLIHEPPVPNSEHWDFRVEGFRLSSMSDNSWYTARMTATVDTGSSLLLLPGTVVAKYYAEIPGSSFDETLQSWLFPCDIASGIPDFEFSTSGGYTGKVPKAYINIGPVPGNTEKCYGGIQKSVHNHAIFGSVVLKTLYVQFNYGERGSFVSFGSKGLDVCSVTSTCTQ